MNKLVAQRMFTFTVKISQVVGTDSLSDEKINVIEIKGYLMESAKVISDELGKEITSSAQVFLPGIYMKQINSTDTVSVGTMQTTESGEETFVPILRDKKILRRDVFYKPHSKVDVGVLYLT